MNPSSPSQDSMESPALRHPGRWLWLLLLVPVIFGLARLRFDLEVFDLLPSDLPAVAGLKVYQEHFANARELVITLQGKSADATEAAAHRLAERLRQAPDLVASAIWQPPWLEHPEQSGELIAYLWFNHAPEAMMDLTNRLAPGKLVTTLTAAREELAMSMSPQEIGRLSYDPFGLTRLPESAAASAPNFGQGQELFSSSDGKFRILFVQSRDELKTYRECANWLTAIKRLINDELARTATPGTITVGYTGRPAFVTEIATGMEQDVTKSVGGTAIIIAVLFWLAHRRIKPMLWLLVLLALILGTTLALGGLVFGRINVVSVGFAAILLGLAVDYAVVHYQEALAHPDLTIPQIRHAIAPSIFWAAVTTISAFLVLNFGGLPGLGQLGTLVGLGVALAALIMIFEFLPPLFPGRNRSSSAQQGTTQNSGQLPPIRGPAPFQTKTVFGITIAIVVIATVILCSGLPKIDPTAGPLRPRHSSAYAALEQIQTLLSQQREPLWVLINGTTVREVQERLQAVEGVLSRASSNGLLAGFTLPTTLWPRPDFQKANLEAARQLASEGSLLRETALTNGFASQSMALTDRILNTWSAATQSPTPFWPTNPMSRWIFEKITSRIPTNYFALGMVTADTNAPAATDIRRLAEVQAGLSSHGALLSGWELLGSSIFARVQANLWRVLVPMVCLVLLSLYLAFHRTSEILLSLAVLALSGLCLLSIMRLTGWSWNLLNLMAIPLVLGTGVDYSIFMQLALRRHEGDVRQAYASVGRALLLCGGTAMAGFGSLAWSSNAGMASLGQLCAVGIGSNMLIAIFLLPIWWVCVCNNSSAQLQPAGIAKNGLPSKPSSLYCSSLWRLGLAFVKAVPAQITHFLGNGLANLYRRVASHRRAVVMHNLAPALQNNKALVQKTTNALFRQFGRKVVDLWRYEAGLDIDGLLGNAFGWEHFKKAQAQGKGVLLLTPHLGNWEFGGPFLTRQGVSLQVLTLAEPGNDFTQLRQASRARWKIETLVVGNDPLAFVEIIKRLEAGATVALLIDRPAPPSAVTVELFGQAFPASIAAAELARASGCVLLPVYIPWEKNCYQAYMLPPVPYERSNLRDRAARQKLTQEIMRTFEPIIRQYLDQWYHFVPLWPDHDAVKETPR